jgi:protein dithiol oxidoreductase (disulfide-forming)
MHPRILNAVHVEHKRLMQDEPIIDWVGKNGIDRDEFMNAWKSFSVTTKLARLPRTIQSYTVETAPTLVVNGRYLTSPAMAEGGVPGQSAQTAMKQAIQVLDALVGKAAEDNARRAK